MVKMGIKKEGVGTEQGLRKGDIILAASNVENPTYKELRDITEEYEDRELPIKVLRTDANGVEKSLEVTVIPRRAPDADRVMIGIGVVLDAEHAVVAKTISVEGGPAALDIPRGARITAVDGVGVSNFFDIIREIRRDAGRRVTIGYRVGEKAAEDVVLDLRSDRNFITVKSSFAEFVPFEDLKRLYKASGPVDAIRMGYEKTIMFIVQTYVTLKRLIGGLVSPKNLMGPVGIVSLSYRIVAQQPFIYYVYFLGLISACIAVFNFLPLPPLDGGLVVLLVVEKIKGSALSGRVQGIIAYVGWALIGVLFLYVTFNDIVRIVRSFFS
jgi:regulator of sigma E protease